MAMYFKASMLIFTATMMPTPSIVLHPQSIKDSLLHDGIHRQSAIHSFPTFLHVCIQLSWPIITLHSSLNVTLFQNLFTVLDLF
jgi:hypothetical protein